MKSVQFLLLILTSWLVSCGDERGEKLASINGEELYEYDVQSILDKTEISAEERDAVVFNWLKAQYTEQYVDSLSEETQNRIEQNTRLYRSDLIQFEWQNQWIQSQLDTNITEAEMKAYYEENIDDFLLNDYIVKLLYIKVSEMAPELESLRKMYLLRNKEDTAAITKYANQYATSFYMNSENWISFEEFLKELPIDYLDLEKFVTNKSKEVFEENGFLFFVNIFDFRLKNTPSPFSYEKERIKTRILLGREMKLREKAKEVFENNFKQNNEIQYFTNP